MDWYIYACTVYWEKRIISGCCMLNRIHTTTTSLRVKLTLSSSYHAVLLRGSLQVCFFCVFFFNRSTDDTLASKIPDYVQLLTRYYHLVKHMWRNRQSVNKSWNINTHLALRQSKLDSVKLALYGRKKQTKKCLLCCVKKSRPHPEFVKLAGD